MKYVFRRFILFSIWYFCFVTFLSMFGNHPWFLLKDPVLWALFICAFFMIDHTEKKN